MKLPDKLHQFLHTLDLITDVIVSIFFLIIEYRPPWWMKKKSKPASTVPGPFALPILGTRWVFSRIGGYKFSMLHEFYRDMYKKYGPVVKEEALWNVPVISIMDKNDIEKVLRASGRYPIRPPTEVIAYYRKSRPDRYASTGIINEQGEVWQYLRTSLTTDLTSPRTIANFIPEVERIADDFVTLINEQRDYNGHVAEFEKLTRRLGLELMCSLVLGRRMGFLLSQGENKIAVRMASAVHNQFLACRDTYYGLPFWKLFPTAAYSQLIESEENIYNLALEIVSSVDDSSNDSVVFQAILNADVDDREKTAAIVDFIASGIHTLGNSLIFLLYLVSRRTDVQRKLIGEKNNTAHLRACVNEAFRLLPTASCLARVTEKDLELSGHRIDAGSVIICQTGLACRNPENFPSPNEFRPERWLGDEKLQTTASSTYLVIPFGCGRRTCPGKRLMEQSLPVILNRVVQSFEFTSKKELEVEFEFLMAPKLPVGLTFKDRR